MHGSWISTGSSSAAAAAPPRSRPRRRCFAGSPTQRSCPLWRPSPMPELPEVEAARRVVERVARGRRIVAVECADDPIVFEGVSAARWRRALVGRRVGAVRRHGKHLWLELDRRPWPCLHFGMTGGFHTPGRGTLRLVAHGKNGPGFAWPPRFMKLRLEFDDGGELAYADARRLGRVRLRDDPQ